MSTTNKGAGSDGAAGHIESAPEPFGAEQTSPDPRAGWRFERAALGGYNPPVEFSEGQVAVLSAAADTMIPPGNGFPAPSEAGVLSFIARYVTPADRELKFFPLAAEETFKAQLDELGRAFVDGSVEDRTERLAALEREDTEEDGFFTQLRALVYYGYYASPMVTMAIQLNLPAAHDYHGPPQPYGYEGKVEPWPEGAFDDPTGSYLTTEDVVRIDIPEDIKKEYGVTS